MTKETIYWNKFKAAKKKKTGKKTFTPLRWWRSWCCSFSWAKPVYRFALLAYICPRQLHPLLTWVMDDDGGEGDVAGDGWWRMMIVLMVMMVSFFFYSGLHSTLVVSTPTPTRLPYIIPLTEPAAAPTGVPPQLPEWPHLSSLCPHHYTSMYLHTYVLHTFINSKLGHSISKVSALGRRKSWFLEGFFLFLPCYFYLALPLQTTEIHHTTFPVFPPFLCCLLSGRVIHLGSHTQCGGISIYYLQTLLQHRKAKRINGVR